MSEFKIVPKKIRLQVYKDLQYILLTFKKQGIDMQRDSNPWSNANVVNIILKEKVLYLDANKGFCSHLTRLSSLYYKSIIPEESYLNIYQFPELMKERPINYFLFWGNNQWRLKVINEILNNEQIKQTNKLNKNHEK